MKRIIALLLALAMVFSLTACGRTATPQDAGGANSSTQEENSQSGNTQNDSQNGGQNGGQNNGSAVIGNGGGSGGGNGSSGGTQNPVEEGMNNIQNGVDNAIDDITGTNRPNDGGVPFDEMLENGKVKE